jgi:hypothetical protein
MRYFEVDKSHLPVIVYRFKPVEPTVQLYQEFLNQSVEDIINHPGLVVMLDLTHGKSLPSEIRIQQVNWNKKYEALIKKNIKAMVFVNKSAIMTFMLKGIFLIQKPAVPYHVFSDYHEGLVWARNQALEKSLV